ncbi:MAG: hypothetical protein FH759_14255 [Sediminimonas qiaohouensis]|uniref:Uncharacterized protein n=1 Tax=Sediminimonas qiaohouensis TaxID=552061 RepID=A0A7C9LTE3_9RHOB|nr:hypothetical protein [Sediminimonas qiaohouensis]MTJ05836.1 hypothetical protein [Sediminimonas qiaohouensis]
MKFPTWTKPAVWGAICGALAMLIIGLSAGWLVTNGTAQRTAQENANKAVIAALTPVCVAEFRKMSEARRDQHIAALEDENSFQRDNYVADNGWATFPGQEEPNDDVAEACAEQLLAASSKD